MLLVVDTGLERESFNFAEPFYMLFWSCNLAATGSTICGARDRITTVPSASTHCGCSAKSHIRSLISWPNYKTFMVDLWPSHLWNFSLSIVANICGQSQFCGLITDRSSIQLTIMLFISKFMLHSDFIKVSYTINDYVLLCHSTALIPTACTDPLLTILFLCTHVPYKRPIQLSHTHIYMCNMCPWCNGYRCRKWTRRHKFKPWMRLIAFHMALISLGKIWIQLFSLQLWVNSRTD